MRRTPLKTTERNALSQNTDLLMFRIAQGQAGDKRIIAHFISKDIRREAIPEPIGQGDPQSCNPVTARSESSRSCNPGTAQTDKEIDRIPQEYRFTVRHGSRIAAKGLLENKTYRNLVE